jgi:glycosyltransferase involved in cell wall biosynthesis
MNKGIFGICFVCDGYPPDRKVGGIEFFTQSLARMLAQSGCRVSVVGFSDQVTDIRIDGDQGVRVVRLPKVKRAFLPRMFYERLLLESHVRQEVKSFKLDIVETHDVRGPLLFGRFGVPLITRMHGSQYVYTHLTSRQPGRFEYFFEKRTILLASKIIAVSEFIKHQTLKLFHVRSKNCTVIYNGVDTDVFKPNLIFSPVIGRILFVGRLSETKGAPNLFRALPTIFESNPSARLRFIGQDPFNNGKPSSKLLIDEIPDCYKQNIEFMGEYPRSKLPNEYRQANVAVFPSLIEAHPMAVLEAMSCGAPTVFMKSGPGPEMITDGVDGILCDTKSPMEIASAINFMLSNPDSAQRIGKNASLRISQNHDLDKFTKENLKFYLDCL